MAGGISVSDRKTMGDLADSVSIRVSISLTLAIVSGISQTGIAKTRVSKTSIPSIGRGSVCGTGDYSDIVRMAGSIGVSNRKTMGDLADSVSIRVSISLTLAIVSGISQTRISIGNRGGNSVSSISKVSNTSISSIAKMSNTSIPSISTVTNGTQSLHKTVAIVHTSYNTTIGVSRCDLADGVGIGITVSLDSGPM